MGVALFIKGGMMSKRPKLVLRRGQAVESLDLEWERSGISEGVI